MNNTDWDHVFGCVNQAVTSKIEVGSTITHITYRKENAGLSQCICIDFFEDGKDEPTLFNYECHKLPDDCYSVLGNILDILEEQYGYKVDKLVRRRLFK